MRLTDRSATVADLKEVATHFSRERDWDRLHTPKDLAIGLITEASELLQQFRFRDEKQVQILAGEKRSRSKFEDEIADVFFLLLRLSSKMNCDLAAAFERKLKKDGRRYPVQQTSRAKTHDEIL